MRARVLPFLPSLPLLVLLGGCRDTTLPSAPPTARADVVASAATVTVTGLADPGAGGCTPDECTLREAIAAADAGGTIDFAVTGTIALSAGQLEIHQPLTITGPGSGELTVSGGGLARVLLVQGAAGVTLEGLTIADGTVDGPGGCIQSEGSTLTLRLAEVRGCRSNGAGGGVGNTGNAAGFGFLTLDRVTVRDSWAANGGGGVYNNHDAQLTVMASTVSGNEGREGGGIGSTGFVTIASSTISGNHARFHGGGVYAADREANGMAVTFSTITGNVSDFDANGDGDGGGIFNSQGSFTLVGSIVAENADRGGQAPDCGALLPKVATGERNLIGSATGCAAYAPTAAVLGADPMLGPLQDNGGPTATRAPLDGSPAIDAAGASCPAEDQRGVSRPQGPACDIGAVEFQRLLVSIDVRPGSATNPVSLRIAGTLPVAVLSSATFDASLVDVSSVRLNGAEVARRANGTFMSSLEDVNGDGRLDLVVHFDVATLGLTTLTTSVTLYADLSDGRKVQGSDVATVTP